jgi:hypothetical protein
MTLLLVALPDVAAPPCAQKICVVDFNTLLEAAWALDGFMSKPATTVSVSKGRTRSLVRCFIDRHLLSVQSLSVQGKRQYQWAMDKRMLHGAAHQRLRGRAVNRLAVRPSVLFLAGRERAAGDARNQNKAATSRDSDRRMGVVTRPPASCDRRRFGANFYQSVHERSMRQFGASYRPRPGLSSQTGCSEPASSWACRSMRITRVAPPASDA